MKIVQLCPYDMRRPGGVQRHVRDLSDWLCAQGHETRIIAPPAPGQAPRSHGPITEAGRARDLAIHGTAFELSYARPRTIRTLCRDLHDWGAEVVHMHTPWTPMLVWQLWRALRLPTVTTIHATLPDAEGNGLLNRYIRFAARHFLQHSQAVVAPSDAPLPLLRQLAPQVGISVLPPAVDLSDWRAAAKDARPADQVHLAFLGRLEARKGVDVLLKAWGILAPRLPVATLTIAGSGAIRETVRAAAENDASGRLRFIGRPDDTQARALLASADLFIAPAPYGESFGIVLAEAMAAGAVPVAAANPGYASVLTGKGAALLVPATDAAALAARIEELAVNRRLRGEFRQWGMAHAKGFDVGQVGPAYQRLFESVARQSEIRKVGTGFRDKLRGKTNG